ncbi:hypothetical protein M413DRAFT_243535 [Hebeloma cylindrosporum]|uniref:Uncharacterized protein n=1 Tax=Hebeloma cylindrosporum TaxID=76867 RepID=A0A0C2YC40_HEBCY|nr:hypothetical protein M413DRAFT_243535 [Hebeloma cylindrosporum h7]
MEISLQDIQSMLPHPPTLATIVSRREGFEHSRDLRRAGPFFCSSLAVSRASTTPASCIVSTYTSRTRMGGESEFRLRLLASTIPGSILLSLLDGQRNRGCIVLLRISDGSLSSKACKHTSSMRLYAVSAVAAVSRRCSLAAFGLSLFSSAMCNKLGYGKGDTILACLAIGFGCPAPFLLWDCGKRIRMSSKFAHKSQTMGGPRCGSWGESGTCRWRS